MHCFLLYIGAHGLRRLIPNLSEMAFGGFHTKPKVQGPAKETPPLRESGITQKIFDLSLKFKDERKASRLGNHTFMEISHFFVHNIYMKQTWGANFHYGKKNTSFLLVPKSQYLWGKVWMIFCDLVMNL